MSAWDADIDAMISAMDPETLVFGTYSAQVVVNTTDGSMLEQRESHIVGRKLFCWCRSSAVPGITIGSVVTLRGATWKVSDFTRGGDGRAVTLYLEK